MGREIKRVPLDFDWPMELIWPGYMAHVCTEEIEYATKKSGEAGCELCRKAGKLAGLKFSKANCPGWSIGPPEGDGWQLWETTTEGSAMSPVFKTPEELARWLVENNSSWFGHKTASYDEWMNIIQQGYVFPVIYAPIPKEGRR